MGRRVTPVRVGWLGAGLIATFHSKMLRHDVRDLASWAGVYDPDRSRAEAFAAASGATVCDSEEEVLDGCDAVFVCTWTSEHRRLVEAAAERGLPVFCEKPLATNLDDARSMARTVRDAGVINQVGLILRRSPAFTLLRHLVHEEASGRTMAVVFRDDQYMPVQGAYASTWRGEVDKAGAGTLLEHSIHDLDLLEWVVGPVERVAAVAREFHGVAGIEDAVVTTLEFVSGAVGTLVSVWHDVLERPSLRRVEVLCERGWYCQEDDWFGPVEWIRSGDRGRVAGDDLLAKAAAEIPYEAVNPDGAFVRAVAEGRPAWPDFDVAVRAHELVDAVYRSCAAGGAPVDVPVHSPEAAGCG